ncbi:MAG: DNA topoisomerase VI subunit B [Sulfolobales archaeon]|nr:DNA topoisomerase VI subunit B [Sulfolobales archaeon]MDW8083365.1 DNA topoisomerase VI subunit B [Sulfolobales archaeon]
MAVSEESFKSISPAEFFYKNKEIAGFSNPARALYQTVRELVENSLDATENHGILPIIKVSIRELEVVSEGAYYEVVVEDNGVGIPPRYVPQAFAQLLFSSKYILRQSRGMFGLGAKMAVLYAQITTGHPAEVVVAPIKSKHVCSFKLKIDIRENKPVILGFTTTSNISGKHGTVVRLVTLGDWTRSRQRVYEYLRRTAVIAPYAEIAFRDPEGNYLLFERSIDKLPPPAREALPHPHGIDIETMKSVLKSIAEKHVVEGLVESFQGIGRTTAIRILEEANIDLEKKAGELTDLEIETLVRVMKSYRDIKPPRANHLSYLGEEIIVAGLKKIFEPEFTTAITRRPSVYEGQAFIVEVGVAYGGKVPVTEKPLILRYANKIPLLYDEGIDVVYKVLDEKRGIDFKVYEIEFPAPLVILTHICSTKIPYRGVGKEAVADVPEIESEIESALREVLRKLRLYIQHKRRELEEIEKAVAIAKYIPEISESLYRVYKVDIRDTSTKLLELLNSRLKSFKISSLSSVVM